MVFHSRVNSIAMTSAYQLQKTDIRVNSICPGLIETGMTGETFEYARKKGTSSKIGQLNPLGRYAVAEGMFLALHIVHSNHILSTSRMQKLQLWLFS